MVDYLEYKSSRFPSWPWQRHGSHMVVTKNRDIGSLNATGVQRDFLLLRKSSSLNRKVRHLLLFEAAF